MFEIEVLAPSGTMVMQAKFTMWDDLMKSWAGIAQSYGWETDKKIPIVQPNHNQTTVYRVGTGPQMHEGWYGTLTVVKIRES